MRKVTAEGLVATPASEGRCTIKCIHNAPPEFESMIVNMWAGKTADEAYETLSKPDVTVTNQSDKDTQLEKIVALNERIKLHAPRSSAMQADQLTFARTASLPQLIEKLPDGYTAKSLWSIL